MRNDQAKTDGDDFCDKIKDYRLTIKVRNNRILKAIEAVGGTPGNKWCEEHGLRYARVNDLINMTSSPLSADGKLYRDAERLCEVLGKLPEELWSNEQLYPLERNFSSMEMDHAQVVALLPHDQQSYLPDFSNIEQAQTKSLLLKAMSTLMPREQAILKMRFYDDLLLEECAKNLGVTIERARQIEAKALVKMRNPTRQGIFIDAVDSVSEEHRAYVKKKAKEFLNA
jgi:RNA polymerase sigma factor (sigma-70 family)